VGIKQKVAFDKSFDPESFDFEITTEGLTTEGLPSTCSRPELVERQASQRGKSRSAKDQEKGKEKC
jgi:hypothetical protein